MKWEAERTIKFIQLYKQHQCLWDFRLPEYKIKQERDAAYNAIVQEMNISGFVVQDVKNKIKNLRSTYQQEIKKIQDTKNAYTSRIIWLKEMEEVFSIDINKNAYENTHHADHVSNEDCDPLLSLMMPETSSHSNIKQELSDDTSNNQEIAIVTTTITPTTSNTGNTSRVKKRTREFLAVSEPKKSREEINYDSENMFDVFGRSVALQLQNLSPENALLAQNSIQNILTEYGIKELRQ